MIDVYLDTKLPEKNKLFALFLTTGWNETYRLDAGWVMLAG